MNTFDYYAGWYERDRKFLRQTFRGDWKLVAGLLAATSPQVSLSISWDMTLKIYRNYLAQQVVSVNGMLKSHRKNVLRVLAGQDLQGRKVSNFYRALIGDGNAVVLDLWMLRLFKFYPKHSHNPQGGCYDKLANRFRAVARSHGYKPADFQAALWICYRQKHGFEPVSYSIIGEDKNQLTFADLY
ncbi:hypothetical protein LCGC14_1859660 [marine sediment metagenome]|uniref:Uncharacterized protein n=1 Tax=marine sediment metagenome TaxID=412755 RepID=A0A0F9GWB5_9ZZZZ